MHKHGIPPNIIKLKDEKDFCRMLNKWGQEIKNQGTR